MKDFYPSRESSRLIVKNYFITPEKLVRRILVLLFALCTFTLSAQELDKDRKHLKKSASKIARNLEKKKFQRVHKHMLTPYTSDSAVFKMVMEGMKRDVTKSWFESCDHWKMTPAPKKFLQAIILKGDLGQSKIIKNKVDTSPEDFYIIEWDRRKMIVFLEKRRMIVLQLIGF